MPLPGYSEQEPAFTSCYGFNQTSRPEIPASFGLARGPGRQGSAFWARFSERSGCQHHGGHSGGSLVFCPLRHQALAELLLCAGPKGAELWAEGAITNG